ncbi:MAG: phosphatidylserine decarboxylase [Rhodocyclaceae bacterium]|jgi:phosphatidylserine decarboxylase|nr:phosphatidylserine decarboxylase [Rhodocyclaceae bacterium]MCE2979557.1 phosphatidylserine decarboxylase [Betaproteobacteria bacterium]MCA3074913.1 phosphatidylserine decarboxylase [Rhodocyclaceae bacterium]MCA3089701.1 phosphatidylserine decarboxylase [Rhodocyclaceae bacterium]MCA3094541.1 phosphatidylserine decarboxylase [Rhodocyclaceae bacterium]
MTPYPHPILAREGWPFIALAVGAALVAAVFAGPWWSLPLWLVAVFVVQFFRDPARGFEAAGNAVISPADGRIVVVEKARDPYLERDALKVSVFMNVFNVHSNRVPVDGEVREVRYFPGRFFNAAIDKASIENERNAMVIVMADGTPITCVQIAGLVARRILCYARPGDRVERGQRFGFIRFGSRVDLYLPLDAIPRASLGDVVHAGHTVLAELSPSAAAAAQGQSR